MNDIQQLIQQLCPDGVEFKKLGDVLDYEQPGKYIVLSKEYKTEGTPVLTAGQSLLLGYTDEIQGIYRASKEKPVIIFDDFTTSFHWITFDFKVKSSAMKMLQPKNNDIIFRYIYYAMKCIKYETLDHARQWISKYSLIEIPVPPIEVQRKIVEILDKFTALEAELEAELEARRKQYEYYRNKLLTFTPPIQQGVKYATLGEIFDMKAGTHISAEQIFERERGQDSFPCYGGNGIRGYVQTFNNNGDFVIIGRQGALCGNIQKTYGKFYATEHAIVVKPKSAVDMHWAFHKLIHMNLSQYKTQSAQPGLAVSRLERVPITVPSLSEQHHIADILDKFDTLTTSISEGLPKEIALRRQQYAYYRNELLSFKRKQAIA